MQSFCHMVNVKNGFSHKKRILFTFPELLWEPRISPQTRFLYSYNLTPVSSLELRTSSLCK